LQVRAGFRNIRRTLPEVASVLFLLLSSQALFALAAFKLFGGPEKSADVGGPFFVDFGESLWSVYVLVTTANHPNVMMPALGHSRWCALFFVVCLVVNLYMFMSVFLAVVYNRFRANLKNEVRETMERTERLMDRAFDRAIATDGGGGDPEATAGNGSNVRHGVDKSIFLQLCRRCPSA
jgi:two pore calcium channel protein 3